MMYGTRINTQNCKEKSVLLTVLVSGWRETMINTQ